MNAGLLDRARSTIARSDDLDTRIIAIPADSVFRRRTVVVGFLVSLLLLGSGIGTIVYNQNRILDRTQEITEQTKVIVNANNDILKEQVVRQEELIASGVAVILELVVQMTAAGLPIPDSVSTLIEGVDSR